ncbi:hypothetical protein Fmac_015913 [Flemingia macrophylla]|uniref:Leucine-rich repeat protein n=1 Tax=Flemingia macrophylla TaxID=520843 RepID=A0ABD1MI07_9FABA
MGSLAYLQSVQIRNNSLSGIFPTTLKENSKLIMLDLGENNLSRTIPLWIGKRFKNMKLLCIRSNKFSGYIPNKICGMSHLQVLYLAHNNLSGGIPNCLNQLNAMILMNKRLVTSIDLSNKKLSGEIPRKITNLNGLTFLNLSHNQLIGHIPQRIGNMRSLLSIDFSRN